MFPAYTPVNCRRPGQLGRCLVLSPRTSAPQEKQGGRPERPRIQTAQDGQTRPWQLLEPPDRCSHGRSRTNPPSNPLLLLLLLFIACCLPAHRAPGSRATCIPLSEFSQTVDLQAASAVTHPGGTHGIGTAGASSHYGEIIGWCGRLILS